MQQNLSSPVILPSSTTPIQPSPVLPVPPKKNKGSVFATIATFFGILLVIAVFFIGGFGITLLKKKYIPAISPVFEGMLNSPGEQLGQRLDVYTDIATEAAKAASGITSTQGASSVVGIPFLMGSSSQVSSFKSLSYSGNFNVKYTINSSSPVLGLTSTAGSVDATQLQNIMSAKNGELQMGIKAKMNNLNTANPNTDTDLTLDLSAAGSQIGTHIKSINLLKTSGKDIANYFFLDYFPVNPYIDTKTIEKKWILYTVPTLSSMLEDQQKAYETYGQPVITPSPKPQVDTATSIAKFKQVLRTPTMQKAITASADQTVNGNPSKCYLIHLQGNDWLQLIKEIYPIYKAENANNSPTYLADLEKSFKADEVPDFSLTMCFDNTTLLINKLDTHTLIKSSYANFELTGSVVIDGINQELAINAPTQDVIDYKDIDYQSIYKNPTILSTPNDSQRKSSVYDLEIGFEVFYEKYNAYPGAVGTTADSAFYCESVSACTKKVSIPLKGISAPSKIVTASADLNTMPITNPATKTNTDYCIVRNVKSATAGTGGYAVCAGLESGKYFCTGAGALKGNSLTCAGVQITIE